jgi:hypothetical protein
VESANVLMVRHVVRLGTSAMFWTEFMSHRLRLSWTLLTLGRLSSTWMPMTSEFGAPMTVTVRLLSYRVVSVPS